MSFGETSDALIKTVELFQPAHLMKASGELKRADDHVKFIGRTIMITARGFKWTPGCSYGHADR